MDASRSATKYTRDDTSAKQFFYYINIYIRLHVSTIQSGHHQVSHRDYRITEGCAHILGSQIVFTSCQLLNTIWDPNMCGQPSVIL